jgi:D-alanine--poly(phosphoribitol) ligase subunit 1
MIVEKVINSINKFPERPAFFIKNHYYSYKELGEVISRISHQLSKQAAFLSPKHIGIVMYEDFESYASCVSLLLAGYGYVPINPLNPEERNIETLQQADVKIVLSSNKQLADKLLGKKFTVIDTSKVIEIPLNFSFTDFNENDPAYIIFTSGSTGKPKGAVISHGNLNAFIDSVWNLNWNINQNDRFLQMSSMTFDMSILTFVIPLCVGACIYTVPENEIKYLYGYRLMEEHDITFIAVVPSTLSYLKPYFDEIYLPSIRYSLVCGEAFPIELADSWQVCIPNGQIINIYGPTEATVFTHSYQYKKSVDDKSYNGIMALGGLVKNMEAIILDDKGTEVNDGERGELCITGAQLTSGYLKNPQKNMESFFNYPKNGNTLRFYKTGDLVMKDENSCYQYIGRIDYQVKIQGHRVELGEIEKHARDITRTEKTIAVAHKNQFGNYQIHLFTETKEVEHDLILSYLKSKLPYYMMPSQVYILDKLPLNNNGKIDRRILSEY